MPLKLKDLHLLLQERLEEKKPQYELKMSERTNGKEKAKEGKGKLIHKKQQQTQTTRIEMIEVLSHSITFSHTLTISMPFFLITALLELNTLHNYVTS